VADLQPEKPSVSPEKGIELLVKQIERWNEASASLIHPDHGEYDKWLRVTRLCIEKAFGKDHPHLEEFRNVRISRSSELAQLIREYVGELQIEIETEPPLVLSDLVAEGVTPTPSKKIFLVHGHDGELKEATARLVSKLNLEPVILHEQARQGRPIIENFSIHAKESGFAIVLLTADDIGSLGSVEQHAALQPRARQNVVFEMGFFFGLLGQGRVCAIYDVGVEMPSDLGGILTYHTMLLPEDGDGMLQRKFRPLATTLI
jgi:predicted nucleotide-binding protein